MSLDVYLKSKCKGAVEFHSSIYVREGGKTRELTRAEWEQRYPGREPITVESLEEEDLTVYHDNITHNLNEMASEAGVYYHLWKPEELGITKAQGLIVPLRIGLELLRREPERFRKFNPENGWGTYEGLVSFVEHYLKACEANPEAEIVVSR